VAQMVVPDAEKTGSSEPVEIPSHGIVTPIAVADSDKTKAEWESYIKKHKLPLVVRDIRTDEGKDQVATDKEEAE
jgi:hypothetical protein